MGVTQLVNETYHTFPCTGLVWRLPIGLYPAFMTLGKEYVLAGKKPSKVITEYKGPSGSAVRTRVGGMTS